VKVVLIVSIIKYSVILNISFHLARNASLKIHVAYHHLNGPSKMWVRVSVQRLGLSRDRQIMRTVDHRLALGKPALPSAPAKKSWL
jgi:hypothetical protein